VKTGRKKIFFFFPSTNTSVHSEIKDKDLQGLKTTEDVTNTGKKSNRAMI
jgi:hypothetical protein